VESLRFEIVLPALESSHFSVLLAADATVDPEGFDRLLAGLARLGASWITCCGPGANRAPDVVYGRGFPRQWHVTTTWHSFEALGGAIQSFLWASVPDDSTHDTCQAGLVVSVGSAVDPDELREAVLAELAF
jgi:hypothetical protein